jgi:uncharacterized protein (DUF2141 family)
LNKHNFKHNLPKRHFTFAIIALLSIVMIGAVAWQPNMQAHANLEVDPNLQPMSLEIVALNGTSITVNQTTISNLPAIRDVGAFRNVLGNVKGLGNYTGPSLNTFCNLVGGMNNNTALRVTASDNYTVTLSYEMVNGAFTTYDPVKGNPTPHYKLLTPILAYYFNDSNLTTDEGGPLRLAIVGPEGLATYSRYWVKWVIKLEIRHIDDVAVTTVAPSKPAAGQGYPCNVNVTVANHGGYNETFNVTAYANQTTIGKQTITLPIGNSTTITFMWNTTGFAYGSYTISAYATPVPSETDTANNNCTGGTVKVTIPGDLNGDGTVDVSDFGILQRAWGSSPGMSNWDPRADINGDGVVDLSDFGIMQMNWGKSLP